MVCVLLEWARGSFSSTLCAVNGVDGYCDCYTSAGNIRNMLNQRVSINAKVFLDDEVRNLMSIMKELNTMLLANVGELNII